MSYFWIRCPSCGGPIIATTGGLRPAVNLRSRDIGVGVECGGCGHLFTFTARDDEQEPAEPRPSDDLFEHT